MEVCTFYMSSLFQQCFITWLSNTYSGSKDLHLGGCHPGNLTGCISVKSGSCSPVQLLMIDDEEADDRLMFHINHGVNKVG